MWEAVHPEEDEDACDTSLSFAAILTQAVATSIDALAVGGQLCGSAGGDLLLLHGHRRHHPAVLAGRLLSGQGVRLAIKKQGGDFSGGVILVLIGLKILLEHTLLA